MEKIVSCLWFDTEGEDAAKFYTSVFPNSRIIDISRYGSAGPRPEGMVMTVTFELDAQTFTALNGGPDFTFNEAVSFQIYCEDQREVDRLTAALSAVPEAEQCGWVKDKFGLSWQIVPKRLLALMTDPDAAKARRAMQAMLTMKRIDIAAVERAAEGGPVS
jgi:predicted 3-demethylubiquinone-9 3-methyltransferase (glyoxalase superfamily)